MARAIGLVWVSYRRVLRDRTVAAPSATAGAGWLRPLHSILIPSEQVLNIVALPLTHPVSTGRGRPGRVGRANHVHGRKSHEAIHSAASAGSMIGEFSMRKRANAPSGRGKVKTVSVLRAA